MRLSADRLRSDVRQPNLASRATGLGIYVTSRYRIEVGPMSPRLCARRVHYNASSSGTWSARSTPADIIRICVRNRCVRHYGELAKLGKVRYRAWKQGLTTVPTSHRARFVCYEGLPHNIFPAMLFPFPLTPRYRSSLTMASSSNAAPTSAGVVEPAPPGHLLWDCCLRCSKFYAQEPGLACRRPSRGQKCTRCMHLKKPYIEVSSSDSLLIFANVFG